MLYVLLGWYDYSGSELLGVFESAELAIKHKREMSDSSYDSISIVATKLNELIEG